MTIRSQRKRRQLMPKKETKSNTREVEDGKTDAGIAKNKAEEGKEGGENKDSVMESIQHHLNIWNRNGVPKAGDSKKDDNEEMKIDQPEAGLKKTETPVKESKKGEVKKKEDLKDDFENMPRF